MHPHFESFILLASPRWSLSLLPLTENPINPENSRSAGLIGYSLSPPEPY